MYSFEGEASSDLYTLKTNQFIYLEGKSEVPTRSASTIINDIVELLVQAGFREVIKQEKLEK